MNRYRVRQVQNEHGSCFFPEVHVEIKILFWSFSRWQKFKKYYIDGDCGYEFFNSLSKANEFIENKIKYPKETIHLFNSEENKWN